MNRRISASITALLIAALLLTAWPVSALAFSVDPTIQIQLAEGGVKSYSSLAAAVDAAQDGDTVTIAGELADYATAEGVSITKNITFKTGKDFGGNKKFMQYNGTAAPLFTVEKGGTLTITDSQIYGNENTVGTSGGFAVVKNGGTLILDGKTNAEVVIGQFRLNAKNAKGGAIYVEKGGTLIIKGGTVFSDNSANEGSDFYAAEGASVTIPCSMTPDYAGSVTLQHSYKAKVTAPSYTAKGYTKHTCSVCGKSYKDKYTDRKTLSKPTLSSVTNTKDGIKVTWEKVTGATGYQVYRKAGSGDWKLAKTITSGSTVSYADTDVKNGTKYQYKVRAIAKKDGEIVNTGAYSAVKTTYRLTRPTISSAKNTDSKKITVKWGKNSKATGYQIKYVLGDTTKTVKVTKAATVSKVISSLKKGKTYKVSVRSYKTVDGKTYYSAYSATKSVKVAK